MYKCVLICPVRYKIRFLVGREGGVRQTKTKKKQTNKRIHFLNL